MTPSPSTPPAAPAAPATATIAALAELPPAQQRLTHLFRHSLRAGELHPLLHLIERYRAETGSAA